MPRQRKQDKERPQRPEPWIGRNQFATWKRNAAAPEYALASFTILRSLGKVSRERYLESMLEMEEKYPGRGWKEQADELQKWYFTSSERLKINFMVYLRTVPVGYGLLADIEKDKP